MSEPPGEPVDLPDHLRHGGSTAYHKPYRCRCGECVTWRRTYDRELTLRRTGGVPSRRRTTGRSPWYVCTDTLSLTYAWHDYDASDLCRRCGADRDTEELWEERWQQTSPKRK